MPDLISCDRFLRRLQQQPEQARWSELVRGRLVELDPPSHEHGAVLMNLGRAIGDYCASRSEGYACFGMLLVTSRSPDTVRKPSLCYFTNGSRFEEMDQELTDRAPRLVAEVVSSEPRRKQLGRKLAEYFAMGVRLVWVLDVGLKAVSVRSATQPARSVASDAVLTGDAVLPGFVCRVADLFDIPEW